VLNFVGAFGKRLTFSIWSAEDVSFRRHHHVVEVLGEHRCGKKRDRAQYFLADINEIVFYRSRNGKNTPGTNR
jgi:hypothetical protein